MAKEKQYHRRSDGAVVPPYQQQGHKFFWDTDLSVDRMEEISAWIMTLSPEQKAYIKDLCSDSAQEAAWDEAYSNEIFD